MKAPCGKYCEKRTAECKLSCEDWAEYEAWKFERYRQREKEYKLQQDVWEYVTDNIVASTRRKR